MKKILFALFSFAVLFFSCDSDDESSPLPTDVSNVSVEPRVGGALIKWTIPADRNFLYLQSRYDKNGRVISTNSSIYTDSVLISGLINKLEYVFELQTFNVDGQGGSILQTSSVRPIRRANEIIYSIDDATDVALTVDMLTTYTQESTEGGKANLIDGDINTYWHTAWSSGVAALPHWIQIDFAEETKLGGFNYYFRQNNTDVNGRPNKWDLQVSEDGTTWTTEWASAAGLPTAPIGTKQVISFGTNFSSKHFRFRVLANPGSKTYTHLGEFSVFTLGETLVDLESVVEENYK